MRGRDTDWEGSLPSTVWPQPGALQEAQQHFGYSRGLLLRGVSPCQHLAGAMVEWGQHAGVLVQGLFLCSPETVSGGSRKGWEIFMGSIGGPGSGRGKWDEPVEC